MCINVKGSGIYTFDIPLILLACSYFSLHNRVVNIVWINLGSIKGPGFHVPQVFPTYSRSDHGFRYMLPEIYVVSIRAFSYLPFLHHKEKIFSMCQRLLVIL